MKGLEVPQYFFAYMLANLLAIAVLIIALKQPRIARALFSLLFLWACITNWHVALNKPNDYLFYANITFLSAYKNFILGWFSNHILLVVGGIATCQGLIAIAFLLKGWIYKTGAIGAIIFLLAIVPLGIGAGFPCTVILSLAVYILIQEKPDYLWHKPNPTGMMTAY